MKYILVLFSFLCLFRAYANDTDWIIKSNGGIITQAVLSRDNKFLLTILNIDSSQKAQVWSLTDYQKKAETNIPGTYFDISSDCNYVVFADSIRFGIWDIKKNSVTTLDSLNSWNWSVKFIPNTSKFIIAFITLDSNRDFKYVIYDFEKKSIEKTIKLDSSDFRNIVPCGFKISPDGNYLLSASQSQMFSDTVKNEIYLLDLKTGVEQKKRFFNCNITDFDWSPDGKYFASSFTDNSKIQFQVNIFDFKKFDTIKTIITKNTAGNSIRYDTSGKYLDSYNKYWSYRRFDAATGDSLAGIGLQGMPSIGQGLLTSDKRLIGINGCIIYIFNISDRFKISNSFNQPPNHAHSGAVYSVDISPDNKMIATGGVDGYVKLWNPDKGDFIADLIGHISSVTKVKFSPDGNFLASGGSMGDNSLKIWDINNKSLLKNIYLKNYIVDLAWSGDSKRIYLSVRNDSIYVFDVSTGNILKSFGLGNGISSMAVSSDEKMLAYGDDNAYVKVIDLTTEKYIFNSMLYISSGYYGILDLEFDKNNNYLSAGCGDFNAWVFDTKKWSQKTYRGKCKYGASIVNKTQFSNNINYLILTLVRFIKVTDIASGMEIKLYTDIYDSNNVSNNSYRSSVIAKNDSFIIAVTDYGEIMRLKSWIVTDVKDIKTITQDIKIYPNPSSNKATIEYVSDNLSETSINIFDINSKLVYHDNITSIPGKNQYSFHVNQLVSGTYWVVIKIGDKILNTKFVMER